MSNTVYVDFSSDDDFKYDDDLASNNSAVDQAEYEEIQKENLVMAFEKHNEQANISKNKIKTLQNKLKEQQNLNKRQIENLYQLDDDENKKSKKPIEYFQNKFELAEKAMKNLQKTSALGQNTKQKIEKMKKLLEGLENSDKQKLRNSQRKDINKYNKLECRNKEIEKLKRILKDHNKSNREEIKNSEKQKYKFAIEQLRNQAVEQQKLNNRKFRILKDQAHKALQNQNKSEIYQLREEDGSTQTLGTRMSYLENQVVELKKLLSKQKHKRRGQTIQHLPLKMHENNRNSIQNVNIRVPKIKRKKNVQKLNTKKSGNIVADTIAKTITHTIKDSNQIITFRIPKGRNKNTQKSNLMKNISMQNILHNLKNKFNQ